MLRKHVLAALNAVDDGRRGRAIEDDVVALAARVVDQILAGDLARLDVVGHHGHVGTRGGDIEGCDYDACSLRLLNGRLDRLGVDSVQHDDIDAGGDEAVDLRDLLVQVVVGGYRRDLDIRIDLSGGVLDALDGRDEEGIAEQADRDTDLFEVLGGCRDDGDRSQRGGTEQFRDALHLVLLRLRRASRGAMLCPAGGRRVEAGHVRAPAWSL